MGRSPPATCSSRSAARWWPNMPARTPPPRDRRRPRRVPTEAHRGPHPEGRHHPRDGPPMDMRPPSPRTTSSRSSTTPTTSARPHPPSRRAPAPAVRRPARSTAEGPQVGPGPAHRAEARRRASGALAPAAKSAQEVATGTAQPREAKPQQPGTQREPRLVKHRLADGTEADIDISEHLERELAAYKRKVKVNGEEREVTIAEALRAPARSPRARTSVSARRARRRSRRPTTSSASRPSSRRSAIRKAFDLVERILGDDVAYGQMERRVAERPSAR